MVLRHECLVDVYFLLCHYKLSERIDQEQIISEARKIQQHPGPEAIFMMQVFIVAAKYFVQVEMLY